MKNIFFAITFGIIIGFTIAWFLYLIQSSGKKSDLITDNSINEPRYTSTPKEVHETPKIEYLPPDDDDDDLPSSVEPKQNKKAGDRLIKTIKGVEFVFRWCPAGSFVMGSPEFEPGHFANESLRQAKLNEGFWIMETEVTQQQWQAIMGDNPSHFEGSNLPVENVSWNDCQTFCDKTGLQLPTEAQWEYACRAGGKETIPGIIDKNVWYKENSNKTTHPVGLKRKNAWNIYDMQGNVWEWCEDSYRDYFAETMSQDEKSAKPSIGFKTKKILQALNEPAIFDFSDVPLTDAIDEIKAVHNIEIQVDIDAFNEEMIALEEVSVNISISGVTLRSALNRMLKTDYFTFIIKDDCILITTKNKADELFQKSERIREVYSMIDNSIVKYHEEKILQTLKKDFSLSFDDELLSDVVSDLRIKCRTEILIDDGAFRCNLIDMDELLVSIDVSDMPLYASLNRILSNLNLSFVIVDECILITTKDEIKETYIPGLHHNDHLEYPLVSPSAQYHVIRGGGWDNDNRLCRPAVRDRCLSNSVYDNLGFRCVLPQ